MQSKVREYRQAIRQAKWVNHRGRRHLPLPPTPSTTLRRTAHWTICRITACVTIVGCTTKSGGDVNTFCLELRSSSNAAARSIADPSQLDDSATAFARLARIAPEQIAPAWKTLATSIDELADLDPAIPADRERIDELARADQFVQSSIDVTEYVKLNCGLELSSLVGP
jgi:hypothetical protein